MPDITNFLYKTLPGRLLVYPLTRRPFSKICGAFMDSPLSKFMIKPFIRANRIDMSEYPDRSYKSFNDFFCRSIKPQLRPVDMDPGHLIAPCDGLLSAWKINQDLVLSVKQCRYTLTSLLKNGPLARQYRDGMCLVFRLCVNNYHRYVYADSGQKSRNVFIPGVLHTVRPAALEEISVFRENCREYTIIRSRTFDDIIQMEVGAMLVGRIVNHMQKGRAERGQEKGYFEYGGSTIILLLKKDQADILPEILKNSEQGIETPVKLGQMIGSHTVNPGS